jgi:hypothetical protein
MPDDKKPVSESELASAQMRGEAPVSVEQASRMLLAAQSELERLGIKTASIVEKSKLIEAQQVLEELKTAQFKLDRLGIETNRILDRSEIMNAEKALAKMRAARTFMESSGQIFIDSSEFSVQHSVNIAVEQAVESAVKERQPQSAQHEESQEGFSPLERRLLKAARASMPPPPTPEQKARLEDEVKVSERLARDPNRPPARLGYETDGNTWSVTLK